ncbi:MAG: hypothetical protein K2P99_07800 [Burkholderiales bacterium]|nr:hypothetical protein [Burkholderiales bacterium]
MNSRADCSDTIIAGGSCSATINTLNAVKDNSILTINEFGGQLTKQIKLNIADGITSNYQSMGNDYYAKLPIDGNFYQVLTITNNSPTLQKLNLLVRESSAVNLMRTIIDLPESVFLDPNCVLDYEYNTSVESNSRCEIILREQNDLTKLQPIIDDASNPDKGNFRVCVNYESGDYFLHKYQGQVVTRAMHKDQVYHPGETINPNFPINPNTCGFPTNGTLIWTSTIPPTALRYTMGAFLSVAENNQTIKVDIFMDIYKFCNISTSYLNVQFNQITVTNDSGEIIAQQSAPTSSDIVFHANNMTSSTLMAGSICNGITCNLNLKVRAHDYDQLGAEISAIITFAQPSQAKSWTEVDRVIWADLGTTTRIGVRNKSSMTKF